MKIKVTEDDILMGTRKSSCRCPVARAASRAYGKPIKVGNATYSHDGLAWPLPKEALAFIVAFDHFQYVKPFEFDGSPL